ncbi:MAG: MFS transporter [Anaerolineae bacterium]|nr:MFS transporter [Anaerolineae bacterium]
MLRTDARLRAQVGLFVVVRLAISTRYRMMYPFLPVFARGLGVDLAALSVVFSVRSFAGALGPLMAPLADRYGRRVAMLVGLGIFTLGAGVVVVKPSFFTFALSVLLSHIGNLLFQPAMQAYLGDRVAYEQRGRVMALTETSWSLSFLITVPLCGLLIERAGWQAVYPLLAGAGLLAAALIYALIPRDRPEHHEPGVMWQALGRVLTSRRALAALSVSVLISAANEVVNFIFGVWMEDSFGLKIAALGAASVVIGVAELTGEGASALLVDRFGKTRSVTAGVMIASLAGIVLPMLGFSVPGALVGLFLFYIGFEFALVSYIPLMTEVMPAARATFMAATLAAFSVGRALGSLAAPQLYQWGFIANSAVAVALNLAAWLILTRIRLRSQMQAQTEP